MTWSRVAAAAVVVASSVGLVPPLSAQDSSSLVGRWTLNLALSQIPRELGFNPAWLSAVTPGQGSTTSPPANGGGGRGRRSSSGGAPAPQFRSYPESADDAMRVRQLTAEVRKPPTELTISQAASTLSVTNDRGQARTFRPDGKEQSLQLDGVSVGATAKWEAGRLVVLYSVEEGRGLRYTYSVSESARQLVVDVEFIGNGGGDKVRLVYEPSRVDLLPVTMIPAATTQTSAPGVPASSNTQPFNQQPDAEFKGLATLGVVVEAPSSQAAGCGLDRGMLEAAVTKRLSDAGLRVRPNSDEDSYVYVDIVTSRLPDGLCVSRYDAFVYTHTTAKLSYQQTPVLVQVSLLHKGGLAGGAPGPHADSVLQGLQAFLDQFVDRIRGANR